MSVFCIPFVALCVVYANDNIMHIHEQIHEVTDATLLLIVCINVND